MAFHDGVARDPHRSLRIIIPAKNEANRISATIREYCDYFHDRATVLVVANGCSDETPTIVRDLMKVYPNLQLMDIAASIGKGGAVRAGLTVGSEPFISFVDADGSAKAAQLDLLVDVCRRDAVSGAIGSRWLSGSLISRKQPLKRRIASRAFNFFVRLMLGLPFTDTQCGAKVFRREAIDCVLENLEIANFAFDVDLLLALRDFKKPVEETPIVWADEPDNSKIGLLTAGSSMFWALVRLWVRRGPLRNAPFMDLVARSSVIPVKRGLLLLILTRDDDKESIADLVDDVHRKGHRTTVFPVRGFFDTCRFAWWYVTFGHRTYDAIVDVMGSPLSRLISMSAKPKIQTSSITKISRSLMSSRIDEAAKACGYHTFFWRDGDGWMMSTLRPNAVPLETV